MPSMRSWTKIVCVSALCCVVFGCGKTNDTVQVLGSTNKHPDTWLTDHRSAYQKNRDQCRECHGTDLMGGITKVDCFNQGGLGQCHSGTPPHGPRDVPHQLPFTDGSTHGPVAKQDLVFCQSCHGQTGGPGSNPRFNVTVGTLNNGCEDCHGVNRAHPVWKSSVGWKGHATARNMGNSCYLCHLSGGSGRLCAACHTSLPSGTIPTVGACVSCHAKPPVTGSHAMHNGLAGVTNVCATCHTGGGSGTAKHDDDTKDVAFDSVYNAKSGTAGKNADGSCANVSCHGGVKTPVWGGTLSNGCFACHTAGTSQFNGFNSGQHTEHVINAGLQCTDCHDMGRTSGSASHFSGLRTPTFELAPSATLRNVLTVTGLTPNVSCSPGAVPPAGTYSVGVCHAGTNTRSWLDQ